MKQTTDLQLTLPGYLQRELDQQLGRMHSIAKMAKQALNEESEIYNYAVFKTVSTVTSMALWKQASNLEGANPKMKAWIDQCIKSYLAEMENIPQETCKKIVQVLQGLSSETISDIGLLEEVVAIFRRRLTG